MSSTTGGPTGPVSPIPHLIDGMLEFQKCGAPGVGNCPPPLLCVTDPNNTNSPDCEYPCTTSADCPNPQTFCGPLTNIDGGTVNACQVQPCLLNGAAAVNQGPCDALDAGDGTCLPNAFAYGQNLNSGNLSSLGWACTRPGLSAGGCIWPSALSTDQTNCPQNQMCTAINPFASSLNLSNVIGWSVDVPPGTYWGQCVAICNAANSCDGGFCQPLASGQPATPEDQDFHGYFGAGATACLPLHQSNGSTVGAGPTEYARCNNTNYTYSNVPTGCAFPQDCVTLSNRGQCQSPCATDSDCPSAGDYCDPSSGHCQPRQCATPNAPCTIVTPNDGMCLPGREFYGPLPNVCYATGFATQACDSTLSNNPATLCGPGQICELGVCVTPCGAVADCGDGGVSCSPVSQDESICGGGCLSLGTIAAAGGECCSGTLADAGSFCCGTAGESAPSAGACCGLGQTATGACCDADFQTDEGSAANCCNGGAATDGGLCCEPTGANVGTAADAPGCCGLGRTSGGQCCDADTQPDEGSASNCCGGHIGSDAGICCEPPGFDAGGTAQACCSQATNGGGVCCDADQTPFENTPADCCNGGVASDGGICCLPLGFDAGGTAQACCSHGANAGGACCDPDQTAFENTPADCCNGGVASGGICCEPLGAKLPAGTAAGACCQNSISAAGTCCVYDGVSDLGSAANCCSGDVTDAGNCCEPLGAPNGYFGNCCSGNTNGACCAPSGASDEGTAQNCCSGASAGGHCQ